MISTPPPRSLRDKCLELRDKVEAFLAEEPETQLLRDVQDQVRKSIEVVDEALRKYTYVFCEIGGYGQLLTCAGRNKYRYHIMEGRIVSHKLKRLARASASSARY